MCLFSDTCKSYWENRAVGKRPIKPGKDQDLAQDQLISPALSNNSYIQTNEHRIRNLVCPYQHCTCSICNLEDAQKSNSASKPCLETTLEFPARRLTPQVQWQDPPAQSPPSCLPHCKRLVAAEAQQCPAYLDGGSWLQATGLCLPHECNVLGPTTHAIPGRYKREQKVNSSPVQK